MFTRYRENRKRIIYSETLDIILTVMFACYLFYVFIVIFVLSSISSSYMNCLNDYVGPVHLLFIELHQWNAKLSYEKDRSLENYLYV